MSTKKWSQRVLAGLGVVALTLPVATSAWAKPEGGEESATPQDWISTIGPNAVAPETTDGTLTIHKYDSQGVTGAGKSGGQLTGTTDDAPTSGTLLKGVPFKVTELCYMDDDTAVSFDPTNPDDWAAIYGMTPTNLTDQDSFTWEPCAGEGHTPQTVKTGDQGTAAFTLKGGLYLVEEETASADAPVTRVGDGSIVNVVEKAQPFLVTSPLPNADYSKYTTDIHVYPKNGTQAAPTKTILDEGTDLPTVLDNGSGNAEHTVTWQLKAKVPARQSNDHAWEYVQVVDSPGPDIKIADVNVTKVQIGALPELSTSDYEVVQDAPEQGKFTIKVTGPALANVNAGDDVTVEYTTPLEGKVGGETVNTFRIESKAAEEPSHGTDLPKPNEPKIERGTVKIIKTDNTGKETLKGAEFKICAANAANNGCADGDKGTALTATDDNGVVTATLFLGRTPQDETTAPATQKNFCVIETKAPDGYILDETPHCFTLKNTHTVAVPFEQPVKNKPEVFIPNLPLTGASGLALMVAAGGSLIAIATGAALVARRRRKA